MVVLEPTLFKHVSRARVKLAIARLIYALLHLVLRQDRRNITRDGIRYEVDISDGLDLFLYLFGSFQKHVTDLRYLDLSERAIVLDVGANAGSTALRYAQRVRDGRVYAFEPSDSGFARLERNLSLNAELARRIVPVQSFVSDLETSSPSLTAYASWDLKATPAQKRDPIHGGVAATADGIGATTLDAFCKERGVGRVDLIKIDTDGHEMAVLNGAIGIIEVCRPAILFEVGLLSLERQGVRFEHFCDFFSHHGYRMMNSQNGRPILRTNYRREIPAKATIDILALPTAVSDRHATGRETAERRVSRPRRSRVVVIGGGIAGLIASRTLALRSEADIVLIERADTLGGLASSFAIEDGVEVERFYHFICKPDRTYFRVMKELGIFDRLRWRTTEMGLYHDGKLSTLGDPVSLARFEPLSWRDKFRFAVTSAGVKWTHSEGWRKLEHKNANEWLIDRYGRRTYDVLYEPLMRLKFREHCEHISAAWIWARHRRLSKSRTITQKEKIGYLEGGSRVLVESLERDLRDRGVEIRTGAAVDGLEFDGTRCAAVRVGEEVIGCDHVISTMPVQHLLPFVEDLRGPYWDNLRTLDSVGVVLILFRTERKFSKYFWMNTSDPRLDLAGIIEYTNLNPCPQLKGDSLVYLPQYVSCEDALYQAGDDELVEMHVDYLKTINPEFHESGIKGHWVCRESYSQPICRVGFTSKTPAMQTPVENVYLTDSHQLHPHDRAISASMGLGEGVAATVLAKLRDTQLSYR